ncbi:hypothetical protein DVH05_010502 [Phytophthora capsici]|nr:hypothetical protein DVH05_010502 [Phytophthora capsici]
MTPVERTVVVDQGPEQNTEVLDEERIVHVKWEKARKRASLSPVAATKEVVKTVSVSRAVQSPSSGKESPIDETEVAVPDKKVDSGVQWASESVGSEMTNSWKVVHSWDKTKKPLKSILNKDEVREDALSLEGLRLVEDTDLSDTVFAVWSEVPGEDLELESDVVSAVEEQRIAEPEPETEEKPVEGELVGGEQFSWLSSVDSSMELYSEEGSASSDEEVSRYARLFSDKELEDMEKCEPGQEGSALAGFEVAVEEEEYDKELEERLFPLDEVELGLKREANEEAQKEPSVEDVARYLDWPVDMVERTREAAPGEMSTPEYWLTWFGNTLESTEEAKRANRDFSSVKIESEVETVNFVTMEDVVEPTSESRDCLPMISVAWGPEVNEEEDLNLEETVRANIVVSIREDEDSVSTVTEVTRNDSPFGKATVRRATMKAVAREAVYRMLKEVCVEAKKASYKRYKDAEGNAEPSVPPLRDKAPEIDWGRLHWHADCIVAERGILGEYWADLAEWACDYYAENALTVWRALCGRFDKAGNRLKKWRRWKKRKKLSFDCSVLFKNGAEALGEMTVREGDEDDISNYVELIGEAPAGVRSAPSSGMRDSAEGEEETEETTIVEDGSRVVCAVENYEALSSGYIDCLPSRMLAHTGATLSLVDRTVIRRLGRGTEPLEAYAGRVNSSSGHPLRVRGWATVPVRLGAFGAVIDVEERTMTLKRTGEILELGVVVVELRFSAALASANRLPPQSQALVMATVVGRIADGLAVLVEGSLRLPPMLRAARSLCTVERGQVIVELCNLSTEEQWLRKGTVVAPLALIPASAFAEEGVPRSDQSCQIKEGTAEDEEQSAEGEPRVEPHVDEVGEPKPVIPPDKPLGVKADFGDSCLTEERRGLTVVVIAANVYFSVETELDDGRRFSVNPDLLRASWCVLFVGFVSHTWRWYEASAGERTPAKVAKDGYAAWLNLLEEQEQARRLSDAFWRRDGCDPSQKRPVVETLSERRARQTAERLKRRAEDDKELARRGRQASVGEDVTCGFGTRVLGTVDCSVSGCRIGQSTCG